MGPTSPAVARAGGSPPTEASRRGRSVAARPRRSIDAPDPRRGWSSRPRPRSRRRGLRFWPRSRPARGRRPVDGSRRRTVGAGRRSERARSAAGPPRRRGRRRGRRVRRLSSCRRVPGSPTPSRRPAATAPRRHRQSRSSSTSWRAFATATDPGPSRDDPPAGQLDPAPDRTAARPGRSTSTPRPSRRSRRCPGSARSPPQDHRRPRGGAVRGGRGPAHARRPRREDVRAAPGPRDGALTCRGAAGSRSARRSRRSSAGARWRPSRPGGADGGGDGPLPAVGGAARPGGFRSWRLVFGACSSRSGWRSVPTAPAVDRPVGSGPWTMVVESVGSPREGKQVATLRTSRRAGAASGSPPRCRAIRRSSPATGRRRGSDAATPGLAVRRLPRRIGAWGTLGRSRSSRRRRSRPPPRGLAARRRRGADRRPARSPRRGSPPDPHRPARPGRSGRSPPRSRRPASATSSRSRAGTSRSSRRPSAPLAGRLGRRRRTVVTVVAIAAYIAFAGASPSVVRAGAMAGVVLLARERPRRPGGGGPRLGGRSCSLADPALVARRRVPALDARDGRADRVGDAADRRLDRLTGGRLPRWLAESLGVSLAAQAATLPIVLASFGRLALISPAVNLLVVPARRAGDGGRRRGARGRAAVWLGAPRPRVVLGARAGSSYADRRVVDAAAASHSPASTLEPPVGPRARRRGAAGSAVIAWRGGLGHAVGSSAAADRDRRTPRTDRGGVPARRHAATIADGRTVGSPSSRSSLRRRVRRRGRRVSRGSRSSTSAGRRDPRRGIARRAAAGRRRARPRSAPRRPRSTDPAVGPPDRRGRPVPPARGPRRRPGPAARALPVGRVFEPGMRGPGPGYAAWRDGSPARRAPASIARRRSAAVDEVGLRCSGRSAAGPGRAAGHRDGHQQRLGRAARGSRRTAVPADGRRRGGRRSVAAGGGVCRRSTCSRSPTTAAGRRRRRRSSLRSGRGSRSPRRGRQPVRATRPRPTLDRLAAVGARVYRTDRDGSVDGGFEPDGPVVRSGPKRRSRRRGPARRRTAGRARSRPPVPVRIPVTASSRPTPPRSAAATARRGRLRPRWPSGRAHRVPVGYHRVDDGARAAGGRRCCSPSIPRPGSSRTRAPSPRWRVGWPRIDGRGTPSIAGSSRRRRCSTTSTRSSRRTTRPGALPPRRRLGAWLTRAGHPELARAVAGHPVTRLVDGEAYRRWAAFASREDRIVAYADKRAGQRLESMEARFASWRRRHPTAGTATGGEPSDRARAASRPTSAARPGSRPTRSGACAGPGRRSVRRGWHDVDDDHSAGLTSGATTTCRRRAPSIGSRRRSRPAAARHSNAGPGGRPATPRRRSSRHPRARRDAGHVRWRDAGRRVESRGPGLPNEDRDASSGDARARRAGQRAGLRRGASQSGAKGRPQAPGRCGRRRRRPVRQFKSPRGGALAGWIEAEARARLRSRRQRQGARRAGRRVRHARATSSAASRRVSPRWSSTSSRLLPRREPSRPDDVAALVPPRRRQARSGRSPTRSGSGASAGARRARPPPRDDARAGPPGGPPSAGRRAARDRRPARGGRAPAGGGKAMGVASEFRRKTAGRTRPRAGRRPS